MKKFVIFSIDRSGSIVTTTLRKTCQRPYGELISNYAELQAITTKQKHI